MTSAIDSPIRDLKLAVRTLRKSPVFSLAAIATLAVGIGANTAVFQLIEAVFLRTVSVPDPDQLSLIEIRGGNRGFGISENLMALTWPLFESIRDHQQGFAGVTAWSDDSIRVGAAPSTRDLSVVYASGDFFSTLQLHPAAGHFFDRSADAPACSAPGVVLSFAFWLSEFAGQSSAIGQRLIVNDHPLEIIGVAPPGFTGLNAGKQFDFIVPLCASASLHDNDQQWRRADYFWLSVIGRLKPGWTRERASAQLASISPAIVAATAPSGYTAPTIARFKQSILEAIPGSSGISELRNHYRLALSLLLGMTALVLLIACANLANLLLARASSRQRELAVRVALGASRSRLAIHALAEAVVLNAAGGIAGFLLASFLSRGMPAFLETSREPIQLDLAPSLRILAFSAGIAVLASLLSALAPTFRTMACDPVAALKSGSRGMTADRRRFTMQRTLVALQVAISVVLLTGALFLASTFRKLITLDPGFRTHGILLATFDLTKQHLKPRQLKLMTQSIVDEVGAAPQVEAVAATTNFAIDGGSWTLGLIGSLSGWSKFTWITPGYFATLDTPLTAGRDFNAADSDGAPAVAIVNNAFVHRYFPGANPLGQTFRSAQEPGYPETEYRIIGVCKDTRYANLRDDPPPQTFAPLAQHPSYEPWAALYVRSSAPANTVTATITRHIHATHPGVAVDIQVFETSIADSLRREKTLAVLSGFFAVLASALVAIGLYGVIAYISVSRRNEVTIRMALGSTRAGIVRLLMLDAAVPIAVGMIAGLAGSSAFARAASSLIFGSSFYDPLVYCAAAGVLAAVSLVGSYLPARRAARASSLASLNVD